MNRLSSAEAPVDEAPVRDELREGLLDRVAAELGDAVVGHPPEPGADLWVRVHTDAWARGRPGAPRPARLRLLLLPVGHRLAAVALRPGRGRPHRSRRPSASTAIVPGYAGGDTRFQLLARVDSTAEHVGVTLKADVPDDDRHGRHLGRTSTPAPTGTSARPGRCSASPSPATPTSRHLYLPGDFEGHPLRKDFPLLARMVKPWPGIVDVEPMPGEPTTSRRPSGEAPPRPPEDGADDAVTDRQQLAYIAAQAADARVNVELETEGMTLNIGPQHPATHGTLRIVAKLDGEQVVVGRAGRGLHAPRLREAHRGPHLPAGHHAGQPHRLAGQLRQRGAVHPRRRAADGGRGAAPGPVDPHDPLRAVPHRQHLAVPRRHGRAARRPDAGLLRLPRPRVRPQPDRGGHRRPLPPELRPHRRPQGRPAQGLDRRDQGGHGQDPRASATRWRTCSSATRSSRPAPAASASSRRRRPLLRPVGRQPAGQRRRLGPPPRRADRRWPGTRSTGRSGPTPTATASPATGCASRRSGRRRSIVDQLLDGLPAGPIMAKVPRIIKVPAGEAWVVDREPARRDGLLRRQQGRPRPVPGQDPLGHRSTTSRSCRGCCGASTSPTSSRSSASLYFILGDIDR